MTFKSRVTIPESKKLETAHVVLAALSARGDTPTLSLVQMQHLLFVLDHKIPDALDGPHFEFSPGPTGPFDGRVIGVIQGLCGEGHLVVQSTPTGSVCMLTTRGLAVGSATLLRLETHVAAYLGELLQWVRCTDFRQRLSVIQARYPSMVTGRQRVPIAHCSTGSSTRRLVHSHIQQSSWETFFTGFLSAFDLSGNLRNYNRILRDLQKSRRPLMSWVQIWSSVGDGLREAMAAQASELVPSIRP